MEYYDFQTKFNFKHQHKLKPVGFARIEEGRLQRAENQAKDRKSRRLDDFISNRAIANADLRNGVNEVLAVKSAKDVKTEQRLQQLRQWKEEKLKKQQQALKNKPKPFTVGIVRHDLAPFKPASPIKKNKMAPQTSTLRITRSNAKNVNTKPEPMKNEELHYSKNVDKVGIKPLSFAPSNAKFNPPKNIINQSYSFGSRAPIVTRSRDMIVRSFEPVPVKVNPASKAQKISHRNLKTNKSVQPIKSNIKNKKSGLQESVNVKGRKLEPHMLSNLSAELLPSSDIPTTSMLHRKTSTPEMKNVSIDRIVDVSTKFEDSSDTCHTPDCKGTSSSGSIVSNISVVSPYVTVARGKGNLDREKVAKIKLGYISDNSPEKDAAIRFRLLLEGEISRLKDLCDYWSKYKDENDYRLPEYAKGHIFQTIGQTRLLISKKFEQFRGLIDRCETQQYVEGGGAVTSTDLQGFWDMVFMQVEDVDLRFQRLTDNEKKDWPDEHEESVKLKPKTIHLKKKKEFIKKAAPSNGLRAMIQASRMKKHEESNENGDMVKSKVQRNSLIPKDDSKIFEAGFFHIVSPVTSINHNLTINNRSLTSANSSFLKEVLSSEARKRFSFRKSTPSSVAIMRASLTAKCTMDPTDTHLSQETIPLAPVNLNATPGRSILKDKSKRPQRIKITNSKPLKTVLFSDPDDNLNIAETLNVNTEDLNTTYDLASGIPSIDISKEIKPSYSGQKNENAKNHLNPENKENTQASSVKRKAKKRGQQSLDGSKKDEEEELKPKKSHGTPKKSPAKRASLLTLPNIISGYDDDLPYISDLSLNTPIEGKTRKRKKQRSAVKIELLAGEDTPTTPNLRRSARLSVKN